MTSSYNPYNFNSEGMSKGSGDAGAHHYKVDPTAASSLPACLSAHVLGKPCLFPGSPSPSTP